MTTDPPTVDPLDPDLLTTKEVAEALTAKGYQVSAQTVWKWVTSGRAGVKLLATWRGSGYRTTREAVNWFMPAMADAQVARGRRSRR